MMDPVSQNVRLRVRLRMYAQSGAPPLQLHNYNLELYRSDSNEMQMGWAGFTPVN